MAKEKWPVVVPCISFSLYIMKNDEASGGCMNGSLYLLEFCPDVTVTSACEHFVLRFLPSFTLSPIKNLATLLSHQVTSLSAANYVPKLPIGNVWLRRKIHFAQQWYQSPSLTTLRLPFSSVLHLSRNPSPVWAH
jgi:hypothetical protein